MNNNVCIISYYDSGATYSIYIKGKFYTSQEVFNENRYNIGTLIHETEVREDIYNKFDIDTIIYCEDGEIELFHRSTNEMTNKDFHMFELYLIHSQKYAEKKAELSKGKLKMYYEGYYSALVDIANALSNIQLLDTPDDFEYEVIDNEEANP